MTVTVTFWRLGKLVGEEVLGSERAAYGEQIVVSLGRQSSWTHFRTLLPVRSGEARAFYIDQAVTARLSVRAPRDLIEVQCCSHRVLRNTEIPSDLTLRNTVRSKPPDQRPGFRGDHPPKPVWVA